MKSEQKKDYEKPRLTQIKLDAKCAVLGFCKGATTGPNGPGCNSAGVCSSTGS
jgi:hypothetical protein